MCNKYEIIKQDLPVKPIDPMLPGGPGRPGAPGFPEFPCWPITNEKLCSQRA